MALRPIPLKRYRSLENLGHSHTGGAHVLHVETMKRGEMINYFDYSIRILGQSESKLVHQYSDIIIDQTWLPMLSSVVDTTYTSLQEVQNEYNRRMPKVGDETDGRIDNDYAYGNDGKGTDENESQTDVNTGPIKRPGYINENVFEDLSVPKRYMFQEVRLGFMDGSAIRKGNREFQYMYMYNKRKKGFKAMNNGYMIWQLHILEPYPGDIQAGMNEATLYFPVDNLFKNLGFLTLQDDLYTGIPNLTTNDSITVNDMIRWSTKWELKGEDDFKNGTTGFWSPDNLNVDFRLTGEAVRHSETVQLITG